MSLDIVEMNPPVVEENLPNIQRHSASEHSIQRAHHGDPVTSNSGADQAKMARSHSHSSTADRQSDDHSHLDAAMIRGKKYERHAKVFAVLVICGTFLATFYIACLTAMVAVIRDAIFGRIFRLMFFAAMLGVSASLLAGINAVLFAVLAAGGPKAIPSRFSFLFHPSISYVICVVVLTAAVYCFILGVLFFIKEYDPHIEVLYDVMIAIALLSGLGPTALLFFACFLIVINYRSVPIITKSQ